MTPAGKIGAGIAVAFLTLICWRAFAPDSSPDISSPPTTRAIPSCEIGDQCRVHSDTGGDEVFVFESQDVINELKAAYTSADAARREMVAITMAGQAYLVPDGTTVGILDSSGLGGWHKVRILSADPHLGNVGYVLDQWAIFEKMGTNVGQ